MQAGAFAAPTSTEIFGHEFQLAMHPTMARLRT
jgi:hypothetical protein